MMISINELKDICMKILLKRGLTHDEAQIVADDYIDAELRGKPSHGLAAFGVVADDAQKRGHAEYTERSATLLHVIGNGDIGHLAFRKVLSWAQTACAQHGTAIAGMSNIRRIATPGTAVELAARAGLISIVIEYGGQAFLAPYGAADAVLSTNPIGIGVPSANGPLVLDMATSERAFFFVGLAKRLGQPIPDNWGLDAGGVPTTNPNEVKTVRPFGGYKGSGLAFMFEILSGMLMGVPVGLDGTLQSRGALCIFIAPDAFGVPLARFQEEVDRLVEQVKTSAKAPGTIEIFVPGEKGSALKLAAIKSGEVDVPSVILGELQALLH